MGREIILFWPLRILRSMAFVFFMAILLISCASIKKTKQSVSSEENHTNNSIVKNDKVKGVVIEEQALSPVLTKPDTAGFKGWFPALDNTGFMQEVESNGQKIKTTVEPIKDASGKTTGYKVNTQAIKKSETVMAPINKKTTINSTEKSETKNDVKDSKKEEEKVVNKTGWGLNFAGAAVVIVIILIIVGVIYFRRGQIFK